MFVQQSRAVRGPETGVGTRRLCWVSCRRVDDQTWAFVWQNRAVLGPVIRREDTPALLGKMLSD